MQIAFDQSEESVVNSKGLGIINGRVKKIDDNITHLLMVKT